MKLKPETTGLVRGGMLFLEAPQRWRSWQRDVWHCCGGRSVWHCRCCGARTAYEGEPYFCSGCRSPRARLHLVMPLKDIAR